MPDAEAAKEATGYERGTITPFGAAHTGSERPWPVIADRSIAGRTVSLGAGAHGVAVTVEADAVISALDAEIADITDPVDG
jgi:prolyl-tRNA editing enzyme YbaK/EbsC (Cys-tRNA(Pro) deacylase)